MQNDFLPGGSLAAAAWDTVVAPLAAWIARFRAGGQAVFPTRDWHPPDHCSFAAQGGQGPPHCIAGTAGAASYPDCAYKAQEYAGSARRKRSEGKATCPGRKKIFRCFDPTGLLAGGTLTLEGDRAPGTPLLAPVVRAGRRLAAPPPLAELRACALAQLATLPLVLRELAAAAPYSVEVTAPLRDLAAQIDARKH